MFHKTFIYEPRCEKTGLWGLPTGPTQTKLYTHRKWLDADLLLCFRLGKIRFSRDVAHDPGTNVCFT